MHPSTKMKFYTDRKFLPYDGCPHTHFLFPVWGELVEEIYRGHNIYNNYLAQFSSEFELMADIESADFVVLPANVKQYVRRGKMEIVFTLLNMCKQAGKKLLIFFKDDSDMDLDLDPDHAIIFRTSFYRSTKKRNEFAMPVWSGDLVDIYLAGGFQPVAKSTQMKIGFCGQTIPERGLLRSLVDRMRFAHDIGKLEKGKLTLLNFSKSWFSQLREEVLTRLEGSGLFLCDFITQREYLGGSWISNGVFDLSQYQVVRDRFVQNLIKNDFFPCIRGGGNYSLRFFEVMSMGKIPLFADTDSPIPFDDFIDWRSSVFPISVNDLANSSKRLHEFYSGLSDDEFKTMQIRNRDLWKKYLSPEGFFINMKRYLVSTA